LEARGAEAAAVRADALRQVQAAEDHVGFLLNESRKKLEGLSVENEARGAGVGVGASMARGAGSGALADPQEQQELELLRSEMKELALLREGALSPEERQELELLRGEMKECLATQLEMDNEAEEREGELIKAYAHIETLTNAGQGTN
jgi:hypothetical protein